MLHSPDGPTNRDVVVFTDTPDWHLRKLRDALRRRGLAPVVASLRDVRFEIGARVPIAIPGLEGRLPAAVMVRGISAGTFEAITLRLGVLHGLADLGVTVWNGARAIERCVDKAATSLALALAGIPTPVTLVTESRERALAFVAAETAAGRQVVSKPLFGSQGRGLRLLASPADLPHADEIFDVWYLQRFLPARGGRFQDHRVFVSAGRVVAGMTRVGSGWITNVHQGATPEPYAVPPEAARLSLAAARSVGAVFAGVDLMRDEEDRLQVLEVNSMPAWRGLQKVAGVDVADVLVADWLAAAGLAETVAEALP